MRFDLGKPERDDKPNIPDMIEMRKKKVLEYGSEGALVVVVKEKTIQKKYRLVF